MRNYSAFAQYYDALTDNVEYEKRCSDAGEEATLIGFLEENSLVADVDKYDDSADAVVMMTMHSSKGLEFPIVFIPGMEEGIFPGMQTIMEGPAAIEEERRLAYVGITRAKRKLFISHANSRMLFGTTQRNLPSRFVIEIPDALTEKTGRRPIVLPVILNIKK